MEKFKKIFSPLISTNKGLRITTAIIMLLLATVIFKIGVVAVSVLALFISSLMIYEYDIKLFKVSSTKFLWDLISIVGMLCLFCLNKCTYKFPVYYFSVVFVVLFCISNLFNIATDRRHWILESLQPVYIGFGIMSLLYLYFLDVFSLIYIFVITIFTDSGAYFIGGLVGGPKLCPKISPKKTISGAIGGILCAFAFGTTFLIGIAWFVGDYFGSIYVLALLTIILSIISQMGDLFESWLKRLNNIKDSSNIIPGHGGVLDRFDSILFVAPVMALIIAFLKEGIFYL
ncbi:phosphatidate cytidylyltransferase [bacterium]|nr:phosphatidate cytidylyltransferase [bacterium]